MINDNTLEAYTKSFNLSHQTRELIDDLLTGAVTAEQFNSRKYRARKAKKIGLLFDMAIAYELFLILKKSL